MIFLIFVMQFPLFSEPLKSWIPSVIAPSLQLFSLRRSPYGSCWRIWSYFPLHSLIWIGVARLTRLSNSGPKLSCPRLASRLGWVSEFLCARHGLDDGRSALAIRSMYFAMAIMPRTLLAMGRMWKARYITLPLRRYFHFGFFKMALTVLIRKFSPRKERIKHWVLPALSNFFPK